jgi:hypothetical protein
MSKSYQLPSPSACLAYISDVNSDTNENSDNNKFILNKKTFIASCDAIIDGNSNNNNLNCVNTIVYYDSDKLSEFNKKLEQEQDNVQPNIPNDLNYNLFRSLIITGSGENAQYVCFSPPHMERVEYNNSSHFESGSEPILQEYIDGTMINVFYDIASDPPKWEIATRRVIGGRNSFTDLGGVTPIKTFRELFDDCCIQTNLNLNCLDKNKCYSFVMQHPDNRIIHKVYKPLLYLIGEYEFEHRSDLSVIVKSNDIYHTSVTKTFIGTHVRFPRKFISDYHIILQELLLSTFETKGVIDMKHGNNLSVKYRNPNYEKVQQIKGNQSKLLYHYLELCTSPQASSKISEFIRYFPEYKTTFIEYSRRVKTLINCIYTTYLDCYINRKFHLKDADERYKTLVYVLHTEVYLPKLRSKNKRINKREVTKFVQALPCAKLMYYLNRLIEPVDFVLDNHPCVTPIVSPISQDVIEISLLEEEK